MVFREISKRARELGLLCFDISEEYGGVRLDFTFNALLIGAFAKKRITGPAFSLHSEIVALYLLYHATGEQKQKYLPLMAKGEIMTAIEMPEPIFGSDLKALQTAVEDKGDHYLVNG